MPQMSSMDWLMLSLFFLLIYFLGVLMIYYLNFELKIEDKILYNNYNFKIIW
nr:ATP synthase F0 subunit 8 [Psyttalia incisi]